jgi:hypothetical protein
VSPDWGIQCRTTAHDRWRQPRAAPYTGDRQGGEEGCQLALPLAGCDPRQPDRDLSDREVLTLAFGPPTPRPSTAGRLLEPDCKGGLIDRLTDTERIHALAAARAYRCPEEGGRAPAADVAWQLRKEYGWQLSIWYILALLGEIRCTCPPGYHQPLT